MRLKQSEHAERTLRFRLWHETHAYDVRAERRLVSAPRSVIFVN